MVSTQGQIQSLTWICSVGFCIFYVSAPMCMPLLLQKIKSYILVDIGGEIQEGRGLKLKYREN